MLKTRWALLAVLIGLTVWTSAQAMNLNSAQAWTQNTRAHVGASSAFDYRLGAIYQLPAVSRHATWYLGTHMDTVALKGGFNPLNVGLATGFRPHRAPWLAFGFHLKQPTYTDNRLVGVSAGLTSPNSSRRITPFISVQMLRYLRPAPNLTNDTDRYLLNTHIGLTVRLGKTM